MKHVISIINKRYLYMLEPSLNLVNEGNKMDIKTKIGGLLVMLGSGLFVAGAIGFITGYLFQEQILPIAVFALIFIGVGASMKR